MTKFKWQKGTPSLSAECGVDGAIMRLHIHRDFFGGWKWSVIVTARSADEGEHRISYTGITGTQAKAKAAAESIADQMAAWWAHRPVVSNQKRA